MQNLIHSGTYTTAHVVQDPPGEQHSFHWPRIFQILQLLHTYMCIRTTFYAFILVHIMLTIACGYYNNTCVVCGY